MPRPLLLGAVADDYTGATDLASMLREQGVRTGLLFELQDEAVLHNLEGRYQALVIALKSRSIDRVVAQEQSLVAARQLRALGARQLYFKYCSTFDSTTEGNIGPVTDTLLGVVDNAFTVAVPALPVNGRTQYHGHLFVNGRLLADSPMRHHPVTPMTDSDLVRHLSGQTSRRVGLIADPTVRAGPSSIRAAMERLRTEGVEIALVDALSDVDLQAIAAAVVDLPLVTGSSGLGGALAATWATQSLIGDPAGSEFALPPASGVLILSGSCSAATLEQLSTFQQTAGPGIRMDVGRLLSEGASAEADQMLDAVRAQLRERGWALMYSSAPADERALVRGAARAQGLSSHGLSELIERTTGEVARRTVQEGLVDSLIVAGGETTGAVTRALKVAGLEIGPALDPGVPIGRSLGPEPLNLVFKSGNFGGRDFFLRALRHLRPAGSPAPNRTKPLL